MSEYRELGPNERIEPGDEYWTKGDMWRPTGSVGLTPSMGMRYRRPVRPWVGLRTELDKATAERAESTEVLQELADREDDQAWHHGSAEWVDLRSSAFGDKVTFNHTQIRRRVEPEYRLLEVGELIIRGDEVLSEVDGEWELSQNIGMLCGANHLKYRRRVEPASYATVEGGHDAQIDVDAAFREAGVDPSRCVDNVTQAGLDASEGGCHIESPGVLAKPPLGCKPRFVWVEHRVGELADAIGRYADDSRMDIEWVIELQEHLTWLQERGDD